jgi:hypothetical protein
VATFDHLGLEGLWITAGGFAGDSDVAAAIAQAESGGDSTRINNSAYPNLPGYHKPGPGAQPEYSVGLWQINLLAHPQYTAAQMLLPLSNAHAAVAISSDGTNFGPWSTYTSGAYEQYLQAGGTPTPQPGTTPVFPLAGTRTLPTWRELSVSLGVAVPRSLHWSQKLRAATLRKLGTH